MPRLLALRAILRATRAMHTIKTSKNMDTTITVSRKAVMALLSSMAIMPPRCLFWLAMVLWIVSERCPIGPLHAILTFSVHIEVPSVSPCMARINPDHRITIRFAMSLMFIVDRLFDGIEICIIDLVHCSPSRFNVYGLRQSICLYSGLEISKHTERVHCPHITSHS